MDPETVSFLLFAHFARAQDGALRVAHRVGDAVAFLGLPRRPYPQEVGERP